MRQYLEIQSLRHRVNKFECNQASMNKAKISLHDMLFCFSPVFHVKQTWSMTLKNLSYTNHFMYTQYAIVRNAKITLL